MFNPLKKYAKQSSVFWLSVKQLYTASPHTYIHIFFYFSNTSPIPTTNDVTPREFKFRFGTWWDIFPSCSASVMFLFVWAMIFCSLFVLYFSKHSLIVVLVHSNRFWLFSWRVAIAISTIHAIYPLVPSSLTIINTKWNPEQSQEYKCWTDQRAKVLAIFSQRDEGWFINF